MSMSADSCDSENDVVFLTPEETAKSKRVEEDQGASPVLRRSNRKRKSVMVDQDMGFNSKEKKCSPGKQSPLKDNTCKAMPRIPRTPSQRLKK